MCFDYEVSPVNPNDLFKITLNTSDDSEGSVWVVIDSLNDDQISPLVTKALEWIHSGKATNDMAEYDNWVVYEGHVHTV
ncbi:MAG: hypothetical protein JWN30_1121 [Bacilli bacterium]|nr:hypothetical protein [Bacilli bacterium]